VERRPEDQPVPAGEKNDLVFTTAHYVTLSSGHVAGVRCVKPAQHPSNLPPDCFHVSRHQGEQLLLFKETVSAAEVVSRRKEALGEHREPVTNHGEVSQLGPMDSLDGHLLHGG